MNKQIAIGAGILVCTVLVLGVCLWHWSLNLVVIENAAGKDIRAATLAVSGRSYRIESLPPGKSERIAFAVAGGDSGFEVDVSFADGSSVAGNFGYVTGGAGRYHNRAKVTVRADRIEGKKEY